MKKLFGSNKQRANSQQESVPRIVAAPRANHPPSVSHVTAAVGWSCASPDTLDYPYILQLAEYISLSKDRSVEAARAIRKELKYAGPVQQEQALRLTGVLFRNADIRFRQEVASRKFLNELENVASPKRGDADPVRAMAVRVLRPLAYECQQDVDLAALTTLYNKIRPEGARMNGEPLDPDDDLFVPTTDPRRRSAARAREQASVVHMAEQASARDKSRLAAEAESARGAARMLTDTLVDVPVDEVDRNEIIREFWQKCVSSSEIIASNLEWASAQATQSREAKERQQRDEQAQQRNGDEQADNARAQLRLSSNNPFAAIVNAESETEEEKLFHSLLAAHTEVLEAMKMYDDKVALKTEKDQLAAVQERSMSETRFDRSTSGTPDQNGDYHPQYQYLDVTHFGEGASSSSRRSSFRNDHDQRGLSGLSHSSSDHRQPAVPSVQALPRPSTETYSQPMQPGNPSASSARADSVSKNPYAAYLAYDRHVSSLDTSSASSHAYLQEDNEGRAGTTEAAYGGLGDMAWTPVSASTPSRSNPFADPSTPITPTTPTEPSRKALGKMRRLTITDTSDEERQRELEQQLRDKYKKPEDPSSLLS